jgi:hypothetical protein
MRVEVTSRYTLSCNGEERTIPMRKPLALVGATSPSTRDDLAVFAMCGIAFAGKSTIALRVAEALELNIISLDAINSEGGLHGGEGVPDARWEETSFIATTRLRKRLEQGRGAVVNDTFSHRFLRDRLGHISNPLCRWYRPAAVATSGRPCWQR